MTIADDPIETLLDRSNDILRGADADPNEVFKWAKRLAGKRYLEPARRLAQHLVWNDHSRDRSDCPAQRSAGNKRLDPAIANEVRQKWALWTSQNPDAPDDSKHDEALEILDSIQSLPGGKPLAETTDPETLGIAGGICKRKWIVNGQRQTLEQSLRFYERGSKCGIEADNGYTAINAAFILDLLADQEGAEGNERRDQARKLREQVRDGLPAIKDQPAWKDGPPREQLRWFHETVAEAYFGLKDYKKAEAYLKNAYAVDTVEPWERETTARQFAWLARLHDPAAKSHEEFERSPVWGVLREVYGDSATVSAGAGSLFTGKLGLALSGGGFRASLFHIGVLAGLAERDMLRHVEVLSCVSGGSILGAHYYLEVRKLLQDHPDKDITRKEYIELVERLAKDFLEGVQQNIRIRIGTDLWANLRMMCQPGYTPTSRLGELYEEKLYDLIKDDKERVLRKLLVKPKDDEDCIPKYDNWRRSNKVPILVLNATCLNTGHNWQFTSSWMGEPPAPIDSKIDGNYRLRRMYLETEAPLAHRDLRIGQAVAASACVPGLFMPLELRGLYEGLTVRLVDGGVHDNQGLYGLLEQNCAVMIVSDASGQMMTIDRPPDDPLGVLLRTTSLLQARIRTASFREIESRRNTGRLKGLLFLHLKQDLEVEDRDWIGCNNQKQLNLTKLRNARNALTSFGVLKDLQRLIAAIRTDLDSFTEIEAYSLMTVGCNMVRSNFDHAIQGFSTHAGEHDWPFLRIGPGLRDASEKNVNWLSRLLGVASLTGFKIWRLSSVLRMSSLVAGVLAFVGLLMLARGFDQPLASPSGLGAALALLFLGSGAAWLGLQAIVKLIDYRKTFHQVALGAALSVFGPLATRIHLKYFDPWFLKTGNFPKEDSQTKSTDAAHTP